MIHWLKTTKHYFEQVWHGDKPFELRKNDRNFQEGDLLILAEGESVSADRAVLAQVSSVVYHPSLAEDYCALGLKILGRIDDEVVMFEYTRAHIKSSEWQSHSLRERVTLHNSDFEKEEYYKAFERICSLAHLGGSVLSMGKGRDLRHSGSGHWRVLQYECGATPHINLTVFHEHPRDALLEAAETPEYTDKLCYCDEHNGEEPHR